MSLQVGAGPVAALGRADAPYTSRRHVAALGGRHRAHEDFFRTWENPLPRMPQAVCSERPRALGATGAAATARYVSCESRVLRSEGDRTHGEDVAFTRGAGADGAIPVSAVRLDGGWPLSTAPTDRCSRSRLARARGRSMDQEPSARRLRAAGAVSTMSKVHRTDRAESAVPGDLCRGADIQVLPAGLVRLSDPSVEATGPVPDHRPSHGSSLTAAGSRCSTHGKKSARAR